MSNAKTRTARWLLALGLTATLAACAGDKKGGDDGVKSGGGGGGGGGGKSGGGGGKGDDDDKGGASASANRVTLSNSLSNNPLTSHTISAGKAEGLSDKFSGGKSKASYEGKISAERLARRPTASVLAAAKKLAELEMEKGAGRTVSDAVKLEVALAALNNKNYALAEYFFQILTDSKDGRVKAGAFNAMGVVALKDDRVPEAVLYFKEALKASSGYKPALLNLGFAALKGGDIDAAKRSLGDFESDWFAQYGQISIARIGGDEGRAGSLCDKVLGKEPGHKAALYNCALLEYQNKRNFDKARALANKSGKAKGGDAGWDDKAFKLANEIDMEEAEQKKAKGGGNGKKSGGGGGPTQPKIDPKPK